MSFKPSDFFIGVTDFFSVILPGAMVSFFLSGMLYDQLFNGNLFPVLNSAAEKWIVFLFATYLAGSLLFGLAAWLDKFVYAFLLLPLFARNYDLAYKTATAIRDRFIPADDWLSRLRSSGLLSEKDYARISSKKNREIVNTFKWSQCLLECNRPGLLADIRKLEADSKFFRSLVPAFLFTGIYFLFTGNTVAGFVTLVLSLLSLYRYADLRYKSTERAFELVITVTNRKIRRTTRIVPAVSDNRLQFKPSKNTVTEYEKLVSHLIGGNQSPASLMEIPKSGNWKTGIFKEEELLYCIQGRSVVKKNNGSSGRQDMMLSRGALLQLNKDASYEIENTSDDQLILLTVK